MPAILVTKQCSDPKPLAFGKNIQVKSSHGNFSYKIFAANGPSVEAVIHERTYTINADDEQIRRIPFPVISFRANTNDELHVDFEVL